MTSDHVDGAAVILENHSDAALQSNCGICTQGLFSVGQPVVFLPTCHHHFHEECLDRRLRTRTRDQDGIVAASPRCPTCNCTVEEGQLVQSVDFDIPTTVARIPNTTVMAQKLVQKLLWSSITANILLLLDILSRTFIVAPRFEHRFEYIRDAGIIPALLQVRKKNQNEAVCVRVLHLLSRCMEAGNTHECMDSMLQVDGAVDIIMLGLSSTSPKDTVVATMQLLRRVWQEQQRRVTGTSTRDYYRRPVPWSLVIEKIISAMQRLADRTHTLVQREGAWLLKLVSADDQGVYDVVKKGALSVLYIAQKVPHNVHAADLTLQHIFQLDLELSEDNVRPLPGAAP